VVLLPRLNPYFGQVQRAESRRGENNREDNP
jgi:hypothetical protein